MQARRLLREKFEIAGFERGGATHAGARHHAKTRPLLIPQLDATGIHGFLGGQQGKLAEAIEQVEALGREIVERIIIGNFRGDLHTQRRRVELLDTANRRPPLHQGCKKTLSILTGGGKDSNPGDDNSPHDGPLECRGLADGGGRFAFSHSHQVRHVFAFQHAGETVHHLADTLHVLGDACRGCRA